jgi:hypothetical protein
MKIANAAHQEAVERREAHRDQLFTRKMGKDHDPWLYSLSSLPDAKSTTSTVKRTG